MREPIVIGERFRGPPTSGNGGYCAGRLGELLGGVVEATLRQPPPLERPLEVMEGEAEGTLRLLDGDALIAEARVTEMELELPQPPSYATAQERSAHFTGMRHHAFPGCFVCGPDRAPKDGLRIFAGRAAPDEPVLAPWVPDANLADPDGSLRPALAWAALDCPGYFAVANEGEHAVLGRMTACVQRRVMPGERHVVMGWSLGRQGRKLLAATALFDAGSRCIGWSRQTWITPA
jgi:hypothetical protein